MNLDSLDSSGPYAVDDVQHLEVAIQQTSYESASLAPSSSSWHSQALQETSLNTAYTPYQPEAQLAFPTSSTSAFPESLAAPSRFQPDSPYFESNPHASLHPDPAAVQLRAESYYPPNPSSVHQGAISPVPTSSESHHGHGPTNPIYYHHSPPVAPHHHYAAAPMQDRRIRPTLALVSPESERQRWMSREVWEAQERRRSSDDEYSPSSPHIFPLPLAHSPLNPIPAPPVTLPQAHSTPLAWSTHVSAQLSLRLPHHTSHLVLPHHPPVFDLSPPVGLQHPLYPLHSDHHHHHYQTERSPSVSSQSASSHTSYCDTAGTTILESHPPSPHSTTSSTYSSHPLTPGEPFPPAHPAAQLAATNRTLLNAHPLPNPAAGRRKLLPDAEERNDRRKGSRLTVEHDCVCVRCGSEIARLIFRGSAEELDSEFRSRFFCLTCEPLLEAVGAQANAEEDAPSYADTLSAAVDRLQGRTIADPEDRPPIVRAPSQQNRKRSSSDGEIAVCDVCTRAIATGAVTGADPREEAPFQIETICSHCLSVYSRCTDCGGGGGPRIGIGKWRSRELFPNGRKTCELSHLRLGLLSDMSYDVWPTKDLPAHEVDELAKVCSTLYMHNMYAGLAVPENLEPMNALATTFEQVRNLAMDSWAVIEPMLGEDVEAERSVRRYIALRWSKPAQRKRTKSATQSTTGSSDEDTSSRSVIRKGKNLAGFVIAELDLTTGSLFLAVTTPWATGETYDATTFLMQHLLRRVEADIKWLNSTRQTISLPLHPPLQNAWLLMFFKKDTRLMHHLENRRNFLYLDDYLEKYPHADRSHFAPYRSTFIPAEYLRGWHVLVRKVVPGDDWNARAIIQKKK